MSFLNSEKPEWCPHKYQESAVSLMVSQSAAGLLLDPGLGKTSITLTAFSILRRLGYVDSMLVIAPLFPAYNTWPDELHKWKNFEGITHAILHGPKKLDALRSNVDIYIINPEGLPWLEKNIGDLQADMLAVDESTKFKDSSTKRFKVMRRIIDQFKRRYILTGTISPNGLLDLFGQIFILDGGAALGRYITHYRNEFFHQPNPWERYRWAANEGALDDVATRISPLVLHLSAEDHLSMPELINVTRGVTLPDDTRKYYNDIEDEFLTLIGDEVILAPNAAAAGVKCRQIANGAVYVNEEQEWIPLYDGKMDALDGILEELQGAPALVLYEFNHDKARILEKYGDVPTLGGGTSQKKAQEHIARFNAGDYRMLLGHPASMGHGLNLQGVCQHVIWFGITWNFEYYDQAIRRVYRQGQENSHVFIYHIVARNTLDERVMRVLTEKERSQRDLLNSLKSPVATED